VLWNCYADLKKAGFEDTDRAYFRASDIEIAVKITSWVPLISREPLSVDKRSENSRKCVRLSLLEDENRELASSFG